MREQGEAFFDARAIWQASRSQSQQRNFESMMRFQRLRQLYPDWWIGFDFVGQEDKGHSLLYLIEPLRLALAGRNTTDQPLETHQHRSAAPPTLSSSSQLYAAFTATEQLSDITNNDDVSISAMTSPTSSLGDGWSSRSPLPLYLHAGESDWPSDSTYVEDIQSPVDNLYDAILLGTRRIGHGNICIHYCFTVDACAHFAIAIPCHVIGIALFKKPGLLELAKKFDVAVEICPISHQMLGKMISIYLIVVSSNMA
jgi:hypothetical protein